MGCEFIVLIRSLVSIIGSFVTAKNSLSSNVRQTITVAFIRLGTVNLNSTFLLNPVIRK